jgi:hypothetical protein
MNRFELLVNTCDPVEEPDKLLRLVGAESLHSAIEALARLYVMEAAWCLHARARLAEGVMGRSALRLFELQGFRLSRP